jgi:hypothetical protein
VFVPVANEQEYSHVAEMYYCQHAHYFAGHGTNAADHICQGMNRFPEPDGNGNITQVQ